MLTTWNLVSRHPTDHKHSDDISDFSGSLAWCQDIGSKIW